MITTAMATIMAMMTETLDISPFLTHPAVILHGALFVHFIYLIFAPLDNWRGAIFAHVDPTGNSTPCA